MMENGDRGDLRSRFAARLEEDRERLTREWLERLTRRLRLHPRRVFPSEDLLDHIPQVISGLARNLREGRARMPEPELVADIARMTRLRMDQGFDLQELVYEYRILGEILFDALEEERRDAPAGAPGDGLVGLARHLDQILFGLLGVTTGAYQEERFRQRLDVAQRLEEYASTLEHQLRNGLQKALTAVEVLVSEGALDAEVRREYGERTREFLRGLVEKLEDVRSVALGYPLDHSREELLVDVIRATVEELQEEAGAAGVVPHIEEPIPGFLVDGARVQTILMNLIMNAIKYSDPEKETRWFRVGATWLEEERACRLHVADNGIGIEDDERERVFQRFFRGRAVEGDGSGLGLSIARSAVQQMEGRIWVESQPGAGSTFYFTIPAEHLAPATEPAPEGAQAEAGRSRREMEVGRSRQAAEAGRSPATEEDRSG